MSSLIGLYVLIGVGVACYSYLEEPKLTLPVLAMKVFTWPWDLYKLFKKPSP